MTAMLHKINAGIDPDTYRSVFRRHPGGIVVVTTDSGRGPAGFTVTSLVSASLDPPLVSFSIADTSSTWPHIRDANSAVINFLGAHQHDLARRFATSGIRRFDHPTRWSRLATGEPALDDVPALLRIRIVNRIPVGDHHMIIGEVLEASEGDCAGPLVYHSGGFHGLGDHTRLDLTS